MSTGNNMMKFYLLIAVIFLSGCQYMTIDTDTDTDDANEESIAINNSDNEYLKIAKELFVAKQYKQSYEIAHKLAQKDNPEAHYLLGYLLYYGYGVKADKEEGAKWIKKSADTGYRPAIEALVMIQYNLTPDKKCPADGGPVLKPDNKNH